ncbi:MAG: ATP-dependent DNA helicase [Candidatus Obscuribacterales bacterium]|nr:ATP-dependent DNA helicase [Candidatus Obscuribacterales bacterium]
MQASFSQFLLDSVLEERFGLESFRPKQQEVIDALLSGKHTLALLPTGYGKSLCYQVPSQVLPGATLVVSPLIALMQDQLSGLWRRGIRNASCLNSSLTSRELDERFAQVENGEIKLLYVAPERFESARFRKVLERLKISLLVIDEAHCISQWGHDFRLQYRNLSSYLAKIKGCTVLALTATATPHVQRDIVKSLALPRMQIISASFDRPNLKFDVQSLASANDKDRQLFSLLHDADDSTIVYTSSRKEAERLASLLRERRLSACCYHAGMSTFERQRNQHAFESGKHSIIVSTVAFGMGIDKADIRQVIHYNMPPSLENYYQEAGRAGRDGARANCTLLYQPKDISTQKWLISKNYPTEEEIFSIFKNVQARGLTAVKPQELLKTVNINESAMMSALGLLKQLQLIDSTPDGAYFQRNSEANPIIDCTLLSQRKQHEMNRLQSMISYVSDKRCRRESILDYFGQALKTACSGCDICN